MKLKITDKIKISEIQKEFQGLFPYLKIEFYKHMHAEGEGSEKSDMIDSGMTFYDIKKENLTGTIEILGALTVTALENAFAEIFELSAQVFRKSGNIWLQTTTTDHLTLDEQNNKAKEWIEDEEQGKDDAVNAMDRLELE